MTNHEKDAMALALEQQEYMTAMRRHFHAHPELSNQEAETSRRLCRELDAMGLPYVKAAENGVIATIEGKRKWPVIGLRSDMDALPVTEVKDLPFRSENPGVMHACGHDSHMAMMLGAARILSQNRDRLNCTVKIIFQPAEEISDGAERMLASGELEDVSTFMALHIFPQLPAGVISVDAGPRFASCDTMEITITGQGGHGAMPNLIVDPVYAGCQVVNALQSICSREIDPLQSCVVSVCAFNSGRAPNVFDSKAALLGTVRAFDPQLRRELPEKISRIVRSTAEAFRAKGEVSFSFGPPAVLNDPACSRRAADSVRKILGEKGLAVQPPVSIGEDFAFYLQKAPGVLALVGCRNEAADQCYPLHHERFDLDESALKNGAALLVQYVWDSQDCYPE